MTAPFPHRYQVSLVRTARSRAVLEADRRPVIVGGPPPEFDGDGSLWSPEHLLLGAIGLCLETTFDAFAARDRLEVQHWTAEVTGTLDKTSVGLRFTRFSIEVELTVDDADVERARAIVERAHKACLVSAALQLPVELEAHVVAAPPAAA